MITHWELPKSHIKLNYADAELLGYPVEDLISASQASRQDDDEEMQSVLDRIGADQVQEELVSAVLHFYSCQGAD